MGFEKKRYGNKAEIVNLTVYSNKLFEQAIYRMKGATTEPLVGVRMITLIKDLFCLNDEQINALIDIERKRLIKEQEGLFEQEKNKKAIFK